MGPLGKYSTLNARTLFMPHPGKALKWQQTAEKGHTYKEKENVNEDGIKEK